MLELEGGSTDRWKEKLRLGEGETRNEARMCARCPLS